MSDESLEFITVSSTDTFATGVHRIFMSQKTENVTITNTREFAIATCSVCQARHREAMMAPARDVNRNLENFKKVHSKCVPRGGR